MAVDQDKAAIIRKLVWISAENAVFADSPAEAAYFRGRFDGILLACMTFVGEGDKLFLSSENQ